MRLTCASRRHSVRATPTMWKYLNSRQPARREAEVRLQQQVEDPLRPLPVLHLRVLQLGIDDLERARERDADAAGDLRQPGFGFRTIGQVERREGRARERWDGCWVV